jgi:hypothetical protein
MVIRTKRKGAGSACLVWGAEAAETAALPVALLATP